MTVRGSRRLHEPVAVKKIDKKQNRRIATLEKKVGAGETKWNIYSKYNATDGTLIQAISTATITQFNFINDGDLANERDGNKVNVKSIKYRAELVNGNAGPNVVRFIAFYWKSDTAPTLADVINYSAASGFPDQIMTPVNPISIMNKNLVVLKDSVFMLEGTTEDGGPRIKNLKFNKKYKIGKPQFYTDTAGSDMKTGFYYILAAVSGGAGTVVVNDSSVTTYTD